MFYSTELLTSRKGGFAIFWLASTVGSKGGIASRKLSKAEVLKSNVVKACEKVIAPEEPLALRLSSNLMMGIARVYQQQYTFYASDVQHVHQALKKAITETFKKGTDFTLTADAELPLEPLPDTNVASVAKPTGGAHGINLAINTGIAILGLEPDLAFELDWRLPGEEQEREEVLDLGEGPDFLSPLGTREATPAGVKQPKGAYQAREADITLQEPQLDDYLLQGAGMDDLFMGGDLDGEQPVFGEGEEGLLEGISPELDAVLRASSAAGRGGSAGGSAWGSFQRFGPSSSAVDGLELGGFDQNYMDQDFGGGFEGHFDEPNQAFMQFGGEGLDERVRREHEEARARLDGLQGYRRSPTPMNVDLSGELGLLQTTPSSTTRKRLSDVFERDQSLAATQGQAPKAPKKKKLKRLATDRDTELDDTAFRAMRSTYSERMAQERDKADKAKQEREAQKRAMDLVFGVPTMLQAPVLAEFWKTVVAGSMSPRGEKGDAKKRRVAHSPTDKKGKMAATEPEEEISRRARARLSEQPQEGQGLWDVGDTFAGQEFGGGFGEYGRGQEDLGGFEFNFDADIEQGRGVSEAGLTGSPRQSMLPWAQEAATSDAGGTVALVGGPSSQAGGTRFSLDTPLKRGIVRDSRASSLVPSVLGSTPHRVGSVGLLAEREGEFAAFEEPRLSRSPSPQAGSAAAAFDAALENDSFRFLNYARRQKAALAEDDQLLFSDIVPVAATTANTAAQAMYHLLTLATKGMIKVQQDEAYGEIAVDIV
ncbi:hypothetical protein JCM11251_000544 [Rhodosporidiobolus azoricus]